MLQVNMPSSLRTVFGKGAMRQLRMEKKSPAVLYSGGKETVALQFDARQLFKDLLNIHGRNAVVTLQIEGDSNQERHALVKEIQKDPVSDRLIHVDFYEIDLDQVFEFTVPIKFTGVAKGVDKGGELHVFRDQLVLRGCPLDIPDVIKADITGLDRGAAGLTFGDLQLPEKVEMLDESTITCVTVY